MDDITLSTYEAAAEAYRADTATEHRDEHVAWFDAVCARLPEHARILEVGSGPGRDATVLEQRGHRVHRTDGAQSFVDMLRAEGHEAELLDIRTGDLGGPWDLLFADAVLLHLTRDELSDFLGRAAAAARHLAFTLWEGDGEEWTSRRLGLPRHYTYWREEPLRRLLAHTGWTDVSVDRFQALRGWWLFVIASATRSTGPDLSGPADPRPATPA